MRQVDAVIEDVLSVEHEAIAHKLGLIIKEPVKISENLLYEVVGVIDDLSRKDDERSHRIMMMLSAIL